MIDKLIGILTDAGPLGILCAVLLVIIAILCRIIVRIFKLYADAQEARIKEGVELRLELTKLRATIEGAFEILKSRRR